MCLIENNRRDRRQPSWNNLPRFYMGRSQESGYRGPIVEGVHLCVEKGAVYNWPEPSERLDACPPESRNNPKQYEVFKY